MRYNAAIKTIAGRQNQPQSDAPLLASKFSKTEL
jgi:hypothetical protein